MNQFHQPVALQDHLLQVLLVPGHAGDVLRRHVLEGLLVLQLRLELHDLLVVLPALRLERLVLPLTPGSLDLEQMAIF